MTKTTRRMMKGLECTYNTHSGDWYTFTQKHVPLTIDVALWMCLRRHKFIRRGQLSANIRINWMTSTKNSKLDERSNQFDFCAVGGRRVVACMGFFYCILYNIFMFLPGKASLSNTQWYSQNHSITSYHHFIVYFMSKRQLDCYIFLWIFLTYTFPLFLSFHILIQNS